MVYKPTFTSLGGPMLDPHFIQHLPILFPLANPAGIVEEMLAFFVTPVTGYYSFLTWGDQEQD